MTTDAFRLPSGPCAEALPAGRWWDAVRADEPIGLHALRLLGEYSGSVIHDVHGRHLYWLVEIGGARTYDMPGVRVLTQTGRTAVYIGVPPIHAVVGGLHWRVPFDRDRYLTDPGLLAAALNLAAYSHVPPAGLETSATRAGSHAAQPS